MVETIQFRLNGRPAEISVNPNGRSYGFCVRTSA